MIMDLQFFSHHKGGGSTANGRNSAGRRQPVCGKFAYQCADDADRKEGNDDDRIFHACTASDHIYSGNQSLSALIRRAKT